MKSILNLEPKDYSVKARQILNKIGNVDDGPLLRNELMNKISNYDIVIVRLSHIIDEEVLEAANKLKVIVSATTGLNHIDLISAKKKGVEVLSLKNEIKFLNNIHATAEHTWGLILSLLRKIPESFDSVKKGEWERDRFKGDELYGSKLGIVGFGRIGKKIAKYAIAFGMNILVYTKQENEKFENVKFVSSLSDLLMKSDIITIHVPLNSSTEMMFTKEQFALCKKGAFLINTSRGEVINESDFIDSIKNGHIGGGALDVICNELQLNQNNKSKIIDFANNDSRVIITPHLGGATIQSMKRTEVFMAEKLTKFLIGKI